jgi:hypothetical protein
MFYVIVFSLLAVLLVVAGLTAINRNKAELRSEDAHHPSDKARQARKAKRAQSKQARRKR